MQARFQAYPAAARRDLLALRELVLDVARHTPGVGQIDETLKWGEPAYLTPNGAGSTVRMDWKPKAPATYALYFNCRTTLVDTFRTLFPHDFAFEGNRALVFQVGGRPPEDALRLCVAAAFTYHARHRAR